MRYKKTLIAVAILAVGVGGGFGLAYLQAPEPLTVQSATTASPQPTTKFKQAEVKPPVPLTTANLTRLTNEERAKAGLPPVTENALLNASAQAKAQDMADRNYWSHDTPDGIEPWSFITAQGYSYSRAAENLACSYLDSQEVLIGWMGSPTHKENIVDPLLSQVGFGIIEAPNYNCGNIPQSKRTIIVQHFATP